MVLNMFVMQGYALNSCVYLHTIVKEKEQNIRHLLTIMGLVDINYWIANYIFDYIAYLLTICVFFLLLWINQIGFIQPYLPIMLFVYLCFGFSLLSYSYTLSLLFKNTSSLYKLVPLINYFILFFLSFILTILTKNHPLLYAIYQILYIIISPFYLLNQALSNITNTINL